MDNIFEITILKMWMGRDKSNPNVLFLFSSEKERILIAGINISSKIAERKKKESIVV
jgi:hypothetical protein